LQAISSPHIVKFEPVIEEERVMLTTSQRLGLSQAERDAAINTIAGEAYQGAQGADIAAVAANLFSRRFSPKYAGNIVDVVKAPGDGVMQPQTDSLPSVQPTINVFIGQKAVGSQIPTAEQRQQQYANAIAQSVLAQALKPQRRRSAASLLTQYMQ
jgi:hypothetical protein